MTAIYYGFINIIKRLTGDDFNCQFPLAIYSFDVSGKRLPDVNDYIDKFIIDGGIEEINLHRDKIKEWKEQCEEQINSIKNKKKHARAENKYNNICEYNSGKEYVFTLYRRVTGYKQVNHQKYKHETLCTVEEFTCSYEYLHERENKLHEINFQSTLNEWNTKDQRKLMTHKLRQRIMERDNYTCQMCGKYMPDEVGLHIDHIVPISKGGKTVESNLRVLCSKCNGHKSDKVINNV